MIGCTRDVMLFRGLHVRDRSSEFIHVTRTCRIPGHSRLLFFNQYFSLDRMTQYFAYLINIIK